jgi:hypothetical protein
MIFGGECAALGCIPAHVGGWPLYTQRRNAQSRTMDERVEGVFSAGAPAVTIVMGGCFIFGSFFGCVMSLCVSFSG